MCRFVILILWFSIIFSLVVLMFVVTSPPQLNFFPRPATAHTGCSAASLQLQIAPTVSYLGLRVKSIKISNIDVKGEHRCPRIEHILETCMALSRGEAGHHQYLCFIL
jgi:hypothetical protein